MPCMSSKLLVAGVRQRFHDILLLCIPRARPGQRLDQPKIQNLDSQKKMFSLGGAIRPFGGFAWIRVVIVEMNSVAAVSIACEGWRRIFLVQFFLVCRQSPSTIVSFIS